MSSLIASLGILDSEVCPQNISHKWDISPPRPKKKGDNLSLNNKVGVTPALFKLGWNYLLIEDAAWRNENGFGDRKWKP